MAAMIVGRFQLHLKKRKRVRQNATTQRRLVLETLEHRSLLAAFEVTSLADVIDPNDGVVSLREAVESANTNLGSDEITFADALTSAAPGTILLAGVELVVTDTLTLTGPGQDRLRIDANNLSRVINAQGNAIDLVVSGLTISGGRTTFNNSIVNGMRETTNSGGGIRFLSAGTLGIVDSTLSGNRTDGDRASGSAVFSSSGNVTLTASTITGNSTRGFGAFGGGIATVSGSVTLTNSSVSNNRTDGDFGFGGGIFTDSGNVTLSNSTLSGNTTANDAPGGGIYSQSGNVVLTNSTLEDNQTLDRVPGGVGGDGGGIYAVNGSVTLTNSTVTNNSTSGDYSEGGGIFTRSGNVTLTRSTLSNNRTNGRQSHGGGIFTINGSVNLVGSTLSSNQATGIDSDGGGLWVNDSLVAISSSTITGNVTSRRGGGLRVFADSTDKKLTIHNSIVAGNIDNGTAPDFNAPTTPTNLLEVISSLIGNNRGTSLSSTLPIANGNLIGTPAAPLNPRLGPLRDNGGPTLTHTLLANSPAIDAGQGNLLPSGTITDQRGYVRSMDLPGIANSNGSDGTDIGAVEVVGVSVAAASVAEDQGPLHFVVTLSHTIPVGQSVSVEFNTANVPGQAIAGVDYTPISNRVITFTGGSSLVQTVAVPIDDDALFENDETFTASLSNAVNAAITSTSVIGTIVNNETMPSVTLNVDNITITESGGVANYIATLSAASGLPVTVNLAFSGTAILIADYTRSGTQILIPPGQTSGSVAVTAVQDVIVEDGETITVEITSVNGAIEATPQSATTEILNRAPLDFGDAPGRYPVTLLNDGARHSIGTLFLGSMIDFEADGQPSVQANGDGGEEDGVVQLATQLGSTGSATRSSFEISASEAGNVDAWLDFNQDGDWDDLGEQVFSSVPLVAGSNILSFAIPAGAQPGNTFARFRLSTAGLLAPTGAADDGEVEDYVYAIVDGDSDGSVTTEIVNGTITLSSDNADTVVRSGTIELFRAPEQLVDSIQVNGSSADDTITIDFASGFRLPSNGLRLFGTQGNNRLLIQGAGNVDFTNPDVLVSDLGTIELLGVAFNRVTFDGLAVQRLSPLSRSIIVKPGLEDQIEIVDPTNWRLTDPEVIDGRFVIAAQNQAPSGERVKVDSVRPYRNFLQRGDVNNSGNVSASDALAIIFELNVPAFSDVSGNLLDPTTLDPRSLVYLDVNGDGKVSSADALDVINILFQQTLLGGGGAGEEQKQSNTESDVIKRPYAESLTFGDAAPTMPLLQERKQIGLPWNGDLLARHLDAIPLQVLEPEKADEAISDSAFLSSLRPHVFGSVTKGIQIGRIAQALRDKS